MNEIFFKGSGELSHDGLYLGVLLFELIGVWRAITRKVLELLQQIAVVVCIEVIGKFIQAFRFILSLKTNQTGWHS